MNPKHKIAILGAGSWGGTLAYLLGKKKYKVTMWTVSEEEFLTIKKTKKLLRPKKLHLPNTVEVSMDLEKTISSSNIIIVAVPSKYFKETILRLKKFGIKKNTILLSATKGFTDAHHSTPSKILKKYFSSNPKAILSGPNIASDVISETPIITVIATDNKKAGLTLQKLLGTKTFRVYLNPDIKGVEIAGALKNVIAIGAGMSDGFGFNISTKASLISRGLGEIVRIGLKEGAKLNTMYSAACIGDLIATCCSENSRNYKVGFALAKNKKLKDIIKNLGEVAEGVETVKVMRALSKKYKIDAPIANSIYEIVINNKKPKVVLSNLLKRPLPSSELEF